jgi:hypothetical protein
MPMMPPEGSIWIDVTVLPGDFEAVRIASIWQVAELDVETGRALFVRVLFPPFGASKPETTAEPDSDARATPR